MVVNIYSEAKNWFSQKNSWNAHNIATIKEKSSSFWSFDMEFSFSIKSIKKRDFEFFIRSEKLTWPQGFHSS